MVTHPSRTPPTTTTKELFAELNLPQSLLERIHIANHNDNHDAHQTPRSFVLYLPTVVLRHKHNPALAVACRLANHWRVPLLILSVILDDTHLPVERSGNHDSSSSSSSSISPSPGTVVVGTARRLAFVLQAHQAVAPLWASTTPGACVLTRVHGPRARTPHHLSLARQASAVVTDEPFVDPYRCFVERIERSCCGSSGSGSPGVMVLRVDGSTTVPPVSLLTRMPQQPNGASSSSSSSLWLFRGVPDKAWKWKQRTESKRNGHVRAAVVDGDFDAPALLVRCPIDALQCDDGDDDDNNNPMRPYLPKPWIDDRAAVSAPGNRPWTVDELCATDIGSFVKSWPGVDQTVPVCEQTHGADGEARWRSFFTKALATYAKRRNDIQQPHAVSRLSCYLNMGTVSIFEIVHDLWNNAKGKNTQKFQDEIIKWREMSYAHAFSTPDYFAPSAIPRWAREYLLTQSGSASPSAVPPSVGIAGRYTLRELAHGQTGDATWDAMQQYLVTTGELHNNARMTWGKTIVEWQRTLPVAQLLSHLAYLNDRYALDGLSPPSYAGLLWCLGWCDKPGPRQTISTKPASRYRVRPDGFELARRRLTASSTTLFHTASTTVPVAPVTVVSQPQHKEDGTTPKRSRGHSFSPTAKKQKNTITNYFSSKDLPHKVIG